MSPTNPSSFLQKVNELNNINTANSNIHRDSEKVELSPRNDKKEIYAEHAIFDKTAGGGIHHSRDNDNNNKGNEKALDAASALTSLVDQTSKMKPKESNEESTCNSIVFPEKFTRSGRQKATPFPIKLMNILENEEYHDSIRWCPDGKSFVIDNPKLFTKDVLPVCFKTAKYSSFTRKLHRWGFQRHLRGDEAGAFFHEHFQRGRVDLVDNMSCQKPASSQSSRAASQQKSNMADRGGGGAPPYHHSYGGNPPYQFPPGQYPQGSYPRLPQSAMQGDPGTLDMAIELEVTRRLRERISAASAFQQQQQPKGGDSSQENKTDSMGDMSGGMGAMDGMHRFHPPSDNKGMEPPGSNNNMHQSAMPPSGGNMGGMNMMNHHHDFPHHHGFPGMSSGDGGAPLEDQRGGGGEGNTSDHHNSKDHHDLHNTDHSSINPTQVAEL